MDGLGAARLETVLAKIETDFNRSTSIAELARLAQLSEFHFARTFRKHVGTSPHAYIVAKRMERAKHLLADTEVPLVEIAREVGYATQSHFTSMFGRHCGTTPSAFRKSARQRAGSAAAAPDHRSVPQAPEMLQ